MIADSGANYYMFKEREFFETLLPTSGTVLLGDGKTTLSIKGVGTVKCKIGSNILVLHNVRYILDLSESTYSFFLHIQSANHKFESSFEDGLHIIFPDFKTKAVIGSHDIYLDVLPMSYTPSNSEDSKSIQDMHSPICRHVTKFHAEIETETRQLDKILHNLREYYASVKTKRQLGFDVPTGFRWSSAHSKLFHSYSTSVKTDAPDLPFQNDADLESTSTTNLVDVQNPTLNHTVLLDYTDNKSIHDTDQSIQSHIIPIIRSVDKPSSSLPKNINMKEDYLCACMGFCRIDTVKRCFNYLYQETIHLDNTPADAILESGNFATLKKKNQNYGTNTTSKYFWGGDTYGHHLWSRNSNRKYTLWSVIC